ncbi:MAG: ABC transporter permease [Bifidobacteriaceae bacterium]|jgi:peptide/nickel transport system permease protein|nr:ABC transporter permease [Bifidobacteriaceae bacterium]
MAEVVLVQGAAPARTPRVAGRWPRFILRRGARLVVSLWVLVTAAFLMIHLVPGDPVRAALGLTASPETVAATRAALGLDEPLLTQYWDHIRGLFTGDLGVSITTRLPVAATLGARLAATATLAVAAFAVAVVVAIPIGAAVAVATRRGRRRHLEAAFAGTSVVIAAIPDFLIGVLLVAVFSVALHWLPVAGMAGVSSLILPVAALAAGPAAVLARITRVEMLSVLEADFVRTARAKRLSAVRINLGHALPNAVTATLTLAGLLLGSMVAGTVLVENVFAWPGLGSQIVGAIAAKDYPLVQGVVLVYGLGVLLINTLVDCVLAVLDPRSTIAEA